MEHCRLCGWVASYPAVGSRPHCAVPDLPFYPAVLPRQPQIPPNPTEAFPPALCCQPPGHRPLQPPTSPMLLTVILEFWDCTLGVLKEYLNVCLGHYFTLMSLPGEFLLGMGLPEGHRCPIYTLGLHTSTSASFMGGCKMSQEYRQNGEVRL